MKPYKKIVDSYASVSQQIAELEKAKKQLRADLLDLKGEKNLLTGNEFSIAFNETSRNTLDRKALERDKGSEFVSGYLKQSNVMTLKVIKV